MPDTRFALAPGVRDWLQSVLNDDGPIGYGPKWDPPMDDDTGSQVTALLYEATEQQVLLGPPTATLNFTLDIDDDGGYYLWLLDVTKARSDGTLTELRLASHYTEMSRIGQRGQLGVDAALAILTEAVEVANGLLDSLDAWSAA